FLKDSVLSLKSLDDLYWSVPEPTHYAYRAFSAGLRAGLLKSRTDVKPVVSYKPLLRRDSPFSAGS
ncbi:MAG TPA: hypothetical protein VF433_14325, partial [Cellvibrio sp.]